MGEFGDLASHRANLQDFVVPHFRSVENFYVGEALFAIEVGEPFEPPTRARPVRRLTTTYTCLESMTEAFSKDPKQKDLQAARVRSIVVPYTAVALKHTRKWRSEGSAWIYSRVRSLGSLVRHFSELVTIDDASKEAIKSLVADAWDSTDPPGRAGAFGIRERAKPLGEPDSPEGYPANAYLTYWLLYVTHRLKDLAPDLLPGDFEKRSKAARDWLLQNLAAQVAFHEGDSTHADPQQLAWAVAGVALDADEADLVKSSRMHDLIVRGLDVFFAAQTRRGDWDRGKPLFNYAQAGNAYCYTYETLAELLAVATDPDVGSSAGFARLLRPHWRDLRKAFEYVESTAIPTGVDQTLGWNSGNHPHRTAPESWATASVFRYAQRLRILVGIWTGEVAQAQLDARTPGDRFSLRLLEQRGATWDLGRGDVGTQLSTAFVLPLLSRRAARPSEFHDPDDVVIDEECGRSAILFGPPGTGKTTLVEAVAGSLGWPFIEVSPAQFLDKGLDRVSARADQMFRRMMELDRCVVLLDEIDELVQQRGSETDPLERFFTTTMLPRLAKLWSLGKILFFANTNNVLGVDTAIRRGQRFDAALLVMPPGPISKAKILQEDHRVVIADSLFEGAGAALKSSPPTAIGWLALTRFDQLPALGAALKGKRTVHPDLPRVEKALIEAGISDELLAQDWKEPPQRPDTEKRPEGLPGVIEQLQEMKAAQRLDRKLRFVVRSDFAPPDAEAVAEDFYRLPAEVGNPADWARANGLKLSSGGQVER